MSATEPSTGGPFDGLDRDQLSRILALAQDRPIDDLVDHLLGRHGSRWLAATLAKAPFAGSGPAEQRLVEGRASLGELQAMKESSKEMMRDATEADERFVAIAGYFLAVAAGVVHHRRLISGQPAADVASALADLAAALPDPWRSFVETAARRVGDVAE